MIFNNDPETAGEENWDWCSEWEWDNESVDESTEDLDETDEDLDEAMEENDNDPKRGSVKVVIEAEWENECSDEYDEDLDENDEDLDEYDEDLDENDEDLDETDEEVEEADKKTKKGFQGPYHDEAYPGQYQRKSGVGRGSGGDPRKPWKKKPWLTNS